MGCSYKKITSVLKNPTGNGPSTKRPAVLVSSTSWTPDEDFSILIDALQVYEDVANDSSGSDRHLPGSATHAFSPFTFYWIFNRAKEMSFPNLSLAVLFFRYLDPNSSQVFGISQIFRLAQHLFPPNSKFRRFLARSKCFLCNFWLKK